MNSVMKSTTMCLACAWVACTSPGDERDASLELDTGRVDAAAPLDGNPGADGSVPDAPALDASSPDAAPEGRGDEAWDALYAAALPPVDDDTRWVAVDGDDDSDCRRAAPCATILRALEEIGPAGQVVVRDGHYVNRLGMRINDNVDRGASAHYGTDIPSGLGRDRRTLIRAETRFGVRLTFENTDLNFANEWVRLDRTEFVWVDGFIVDWLGDGGDPAYIVQLGRENVLSRCILRRDAVDDYGGTISMAARDSHSLVQDVHGVGGGRYMVQTGPGTSGEGGRGIIRRAVFRLDFSGTNQPIATYSHYGNNSADGSQGALFQNTIAVNGPDIDTGRGSYSYKWGSYYNPKNALGVRYQGAMSIREGGQSGFWPNDNVGSPQSSAIDTLVVGGGISVGVRASAGLARVERATIVGVDECFRGDPIEAAASECLESIPDVIVDRPGGAQVTHAYGSFLSVWGEPGHDELTAMPLWPFPYESVIQDVFSEELEPPSGYTPTSNDTHRGFCSGTSLDGSPMTLTRYVHELGGVATPAAVYGP